MHRGIYFLFFEICNNYSCFYTYTRDGYINCTSNGCLSRRFPRQSRQRSTPGKLPSINKNYIISDLLTIYVYFEHNLFDCLRLTLNLLLIKLKRKSTEAEICNNICVSFLIFIYSLEYYCYLFDVYLGPDVYLNLCI